MLSEGHRHRRFALTARVESAGRGERSKSMTARLIARAILTGCIVLIFAACGIGAPAYRPLESGQQAEIVVRKFHLAPPAGYTGDTDFGGLFAEYLAGALQERGLQASVIAQDASVPPGARQLVEGEITVIDPGSWNLRFWVSMGAGRARFGARVRVVDIRSNQTIYEATLERQSGSFQGQENILRRCAAALAQSFAAQIPVTIYAGLRRYTASALHGSTKPASVSTSPVRISSFSSIRLNGISVLGSRPVSLQKLRSIRRAPRSQTERPSIHPPPPRCCARAASAPTARRPCGRTAASAAPERL